MFQQGFEHPSKSLVLVTDEISTYFAIVQIPIKRVLGKFWGMNEVSVKLFKIEGKQNYSRKNIFFRLYKMLTKKSLEN